MSQQKMTLPRLSSRSHRAPNLLEISLMHWVTPIDQLKVFLDPKEN